MIRRSQTIETPKSTPSYIATLQMAHLELCTFGCESRKACLRRKNDGQNLCGMPKKMVRVCGEAAGFRSYVAYYRRKTFPIFKNQRNWWIAGPRWDPNCSYPILKSLDSRTWWLASEENWRINLKLLWGLLFDLASHNNRSVGFLFWKISPSFRIQAAIRENRMMLEVLWLEIFCFLKNGILGSLGIGVLPVLWIREQIKSKIYVKYWKKSVSKPLLKVSFS